jgi:predicted enzyme related to lactoylglutathione lyase
MPISHLARSALACAGLTFMGALQVLAQTPAKEPEGLRPPTLNAKPEARIPGKFIWFDLVTPEPYASKAFYGVVFNWDFHSIGSGSGRYTLIENKGRNIGGMHFRPGAKGDKGPANGSRWLALMSVSDTAQAAKYVETHGGKVIVAPTRFEGRGTHAVFRDDDGAVFGVLMSDSGDPPETAPVNGEFLWLDLFSRDPKKSAEFYRGLGGYDVTAKEISPQTLRIALATGGVTRASIITMPKEVAQPGWLPFVQMDDVAATVKRASANGGKVLLAPRPEYYGGHIAVIADPLGGVIGIVNRAEASKKGPAK